MGSQCPKTDESFIKKVRLLTNPDYRTAVSLLWPLPLSSGIIIAVLRPKPPGSLWGGASGEEPPGSLRESLGKIPAPGGLREPPGSFRDPPGPGASGPDRVARISRPIQGRSRHRGVIQTASACFFFTQASPQSTQYRTILGSILRRTTHPSPIT